jgi:hypothetical protein
VSTDRWDARLVTFGAGADIRRLDGGQCVDHQGQWPLDVDVDQK